MKSYDQLKPKIKAIQQQILKAKKNELAKALKEVSVFAKSFDLPLECHKVCSLMVCRANE